MKKILLSTIVLTMLLNCSPRTNIPPTYHVKVVEDNSHKKGFMSKVVLSIWKKTGNSVKEVFIAISTNLTANDITKRVENYMKKRTVVDINKMNQHFNGQIRVALIENFSPTQESFKTMTPISFNLNLRQNAYVYLISVSANESCLIFPNARDSRNYFGINNNYLPSTNQYQMISDQEGSEIFYLVSSLEMQFFNEFKAKSIYKCTSRGKGLQKVAELNNSHLSQVAESVVSVVK